MCFWAFFLAGTGAFVCASNYGKRSVAAELLTPSMTSRLPARVDQNTLHQDVQEAYALLGRLPQRS